MRCSSFAFQAATALVLLAASSFVGGQPAPPWVAEMPTVERVRADVQGSGRLDTLARQKAAFEQLFRVVEVAAGARQFRLTPAEQRWRDAYRGAADATRRDAHSGLSNSPPNPFVKSPLQEWNALAAEYERDPKGRDALLRKYFSDRAHAALSAAVAADEASRAPRTKLAQRYGPQTGTWGLLARAIAWLVLALVVLAFVREFLPFGVSPRDPLKLRAGWRSWRLEWATGRVASYYRRDQREDTPLPTEFRDVFGNTFEYVGPKEREKVHEMLILVGDDGRQHAVLLVNSGIVIPEGHVATAVWVPTRGGSTYLFLYDRTLSKASFVARALAEMLGVSRLMYLPVLAVAVILGSGIAAVYGAGMSETTGALTGMFVGGIGAAAAFLFITTRRARRFMKRDAPHVVAAIDQQASAKSG